MTDIVREWIEKAEEDFLVASELRSLGKDRANNAICYHSQQSVEKYLKGFLEHRRIDFPRTHELTRLLELTLSIQPLWESWRSSFALLTEFGTEFRYPGESADREDALKAFAICEAFCSEIRVLFD